MKLIITLLFITLSIHAHNKSICGDSDDRNLSQDLRVGRASDLNSKVGCSATLIGRTCAISAGHCVGALEKVQFRVPLSNQYGAVAAEKEDTYIRTKDYLRYQNNGAGHDWAVIRLIPNSTTGMYPGDVYGHFDVNLSYYPKIGDALSTTGYGEDRTDLVKSFSQQSASGEFVKKGPWYKKSIFAHNIDTTVGSSGSAIYLSGTGEIIGIHTDGGCESKDSNKGTLISLKPELKEAIQTCLRYESTIED